MKQLLIFIGFFIILGCSHTLPTTLMPVKISLVSQNLMKQTIGEGGNPEVINDCLGKKSFEKELCLNNIFPHNINILIYPTGGKRIMLAGRGVTLKQRKITLKDDDKILLYIDVSNVKIPLKSNILSTKFSYKQDTLVVDINLVDVQKYIRLTDNNGKLLLEYTIIK